MEAVAAAASIAGIAAFAGQCVDTVLKIRNFYHDATRASSEIDSFVRNIDSLSKVLEGVKEICTAIEATEPASRPAFNIASLQIQVEDCKKDLTQWLKIAQDLHPTKWPEGPPRGTVFTFRSFRAAIDKKSVKNMQEQLATHERGINSCLAVIGRQLDLRNISTLQTVVSQVAATRTSSDLILQQMDTATEIIRGVASSAGSIQAMSGVGSERLEQIESTTRKTAENMEKLVNYVEQSISRRSSQSRLSSPTCVVPPVADPHNSPVYRRSSQSRAASPISPLVSVEHHYQSVVDSHTRPRRILSPMSPTGPPYPPVRYSSDKQTSENMPLPTTPPALPYNIPSPMTDPPMFPLHAAPAYTTPTGPSAAADHHLMVTINTGSGPFSVPVDFQAASRTADEKRLRNAGAYARFRQRRKEKERESLHKTANLERQISELQGNPLNWKSALQDHLSFILEETSATLTQPVSEYLGYWSMWNMMKNHTAFCREADSSSIVSNWGVPSFPLQQKRLKLGAYILRARELCLKEGHDIDAYEQTKNVEEELRLVGINSSNYREFIGYGIYEDMPVQPCSSGHPWTTTRDRVNGWLLDCLQSSETLIRVHKGILEIPDLDNVEWARLVLKYWPLDEAATGDPSEPCSTDGAVGSFGGRHTARFTITKDEGMGKKRANSAAFHDSDISKPPAKQAKPDLSFILNEFETKS